MLILNRSIKKRSDNRVEQFYPKADLLLSLESFEKLIYFFFFNSFSSLVSKLRRIYFGRICFVGKHLQDVANFQWKIDYGYSLPMLG